MFAWLRRRVSRSATEARRSILAGTAPPHLRVHGTLDLSGSPELVLLPDYLRVPRLNVSDCRQLRGLPAGLQCGELMLRRTNIESLPDDLLQTRSIDAQGCRKLKAVPPLRLDALDLRGCAALESLPEGLAVRRLNLSGCVRLEALPASAAVAARQLDLSDCVGLSTLPDAFGPLEWLNVIGCSRLESLPDGIRIRSWIDVAGTSLRQLPWSLRSVRVLCRGVPVPDRIALDPESISVDEILAERNATMRRVLLDRVGLKWFVERANATIIDVDEDAGGRRRLLKVVLDGGEDIVCVEVCCPSTSGIYFLRVPPEMKSCRQAVAWTAGFSSVEAYRPGIET